MAGVGGGGGVGGDPAAAPPASRRSSKDSDESRSTGNPPSNQSSLGRDLSNAGVAPDLRAYILGRLESSEKERLEERARAERERERAEQERARAEQERAARIAAEQRWCTVA